MRYLSLFSGIEAASCAWGRLGWEPVAFSEIDPFACAVLDARFPRVPNLGDITEIDWEEFNRVHGAVDVVVGGSPCQSFSIAGDRTGLAGESGLMWEYVRAVRGVMPRWLVWENVPGALSSSKGEDFRCLLRALDDLGYGLAWRVLDAEFVRIPVRDDRGRIAGWIGPVAQRRRRLFLVGHLGDVRAADVLFEPESLRRDHPTGRAKREELAAAARRGAQGEGGVARALTQYGEEIAGTLVATASSACADRGMNVLCFTAEHGGDTNMGLSEDMSPTVSAKHAPSVLCMADDNGRTAVEADMCGTLKCGGSPPSVLAFAQNTRDEVRYVGGDGQICGALSASAGMKQTTYVMITANTSANGSNVSEDVAYTLDRTNANAVCAGPAGVDSDACAECPRVGECWTVRRLTPVECERLMGFEDGWTDVPYRGKAHPPDTPRYRALGNSFAVPVIGWIGGRIGMCERGEL